ncbi:DeoR/GlpR transcriptional regulator [Tessaracoccus sp. SD287]|uniref:DeoR/GlpR family DNA-binding transcription regulator n=1 Tax=Tessaracoccus sp. SD287 TaxID=2782008 RepID=UPI001A96583E|nr:DeoR/GlpR family DNA-binding transcription regulator [Tessaracoccus sp. SD287]MBO1030034.1 DeoR/GlpR transcriptional regulator [Tessaracoccus sp. SD287]
MTRPTTRQQRLVSLAEFVLESGAVPMRDLADRFEISRMTVYRDVAELERAGVVFLRGGEAVAGASSFTETTNAFRSTLNADRKVAAARTVCAMLRPGSTLMLDDSSTALKLVPMLADLAPLTVITHSQAVANAVAAIPQLRLFVTGGRYRPSFESFLGEATVNALRQVSADVCVMSVTAISDAVAYHPMEENVAVKRAMMRQADRSILLVDASKFGHRATHRVADLTEFDDVVISGEVAAGERAALGEVNVTWVGE